MAGVQRVCGDHRTGRVATLSAVSPRKRLAALAVLLVALVVGRRAGDAAEDQHTPQREPVQVRGHARRWPARPPRWRSLHAQGNQLLSGGTKAFEARLRRCAAIPWSSTSGLRGAGPARPSFPAYQRASVAFGRRVAFIGIDGKDHNAAAAAFLQPLPGQLSQLHRPSREHRPLHPGRHLLPPDRLHRSPGQARSSITPALTRLPPRWRRTSGGTRCDDRRAHLRGTPRARRR